MIQSRPGESLHDYLKRIDPIMAERLHPNNTRKISRSIETYLNTGVPHSTLLERQQARLHGVVGPYNCRVFWLDADRDVLDARLDSRVDKMMAAGLLEEVRGLRAALQEEAATATAAASTAEPGDVALADGGPALDRPKRGAVGLLQAIGYKEFSEYLDLKDDPTSTPEAVAAALEACVASLKRTTRRYARQQNQFVRNRFVKRGVPVVRLDTSDVGAWDAAVREPAFREVEALLRGDAHVVPATSDVDRIKAWKKFHCDVCDRMLDGQRDWDAHLKSRKHRRAVEGQKKRRRRQQHLEAAAARAGDGNDDDADNNSNNAKHHKGDTK